MRGRSISSGRRKLFMGAPPLNPSHVDGERAQHATATHSTRARLPQSITIHRKSLMSMHDLSPELLCLIFHMAVHDGCMDDGEHSNSPRTAVALSDTCSYWRQVCLAYPDMWTFLPVGNMPSDLRCLFLERSASKLLTLYFNFEDLNLGRGKYEPLTRRARRVHLHEVVNLRLPHDLSHLEELIIKHKKPVHMQSVLEMNIFNMRKLSLSGFFIVPTAVPLLRLTKLRLTGERVQCLLLLRFLLAAPTLAIFYLEVDRVVDLHSDSSGTFEHDGLVSLPAMRKMTLRLHTNDIHRFLGTISPPYAASYDLKIIPRWSHATPSPTAIANCIPTSSFPRPLSTGTRTKVIFMHRRPHGGNIPSISLRIRNYAENSDSHPCRRSSIFVSLGPTKDWRTSDIVHLLDALLLSPETGTNDHVVLLQLPGELLGRQDSRLPSSMLTARFPRLKQFAFECEPGRSSAMNMRVPADALLQIAPPSLLLDSATQQEPVHPHDHCARTLGFKHLNISGMCLHSGLLSALMANTTVMHGLSGGTVTFSLCRIIAVDEREVRSMFQTEAVKKFHVQVYLDKCKIVLQECDGLVERSAGTKRLYRAGKSAIGT